MVVAGTKQCAMAPGNGSGIPVFTASRPESLPRAATSLPVESSRAEARRRRYVYERGVREAGARLPRQVRCQREALFSMLRHVCFRFCQIFAHPSRVPATRQAGATPTSLPTCRVVNRQAEAHYLTPGCCLLPVRQRRRCRPVRYYRCRDAHAATSTKQEMFTPRRRFLQESFAIFR